MINQGFAQQGQQNQCATGVTFTNNTEQPTRFSQCAARLDARAAHLAQLIMRASSIADRLGGSIPQPAEDNKKLRGNGGCVAGQIELALDDVDSLTSRFEGVLQRLESL